MSLEQYKGNVALKWCCSVGKWLWKQWDLSIPETKVQQLFIFLLSVKDANPSPRSQFSTIYIISSFLKKIHLLQQVFLLSLLLLRRYEKLSCTVIWLVCRCFTSLFFLLTVLLSVCPPRGANPLDHRDNSFSRSRSSSVTSIDKEAREAISSFHFCETFARKGDGALTPCLYVGTTLGTVLVLAITLPPAGEQRQLQPVIISPAGGQRNLDHWTLKWFLTSLYKGISKCSSTLGNEVLQPVFFLLSIRYAGAAEGQHFADGFHRLHGLSAASCVRVLVWTQHHGRRWRKRKSPKAPACFRVPVHVPGPQWEPVRCGVLRETGQSHCPPLPDLHLQTQHHRDVLHLTGRCGADEPRRVRGVFLRQWPHHDPQVSLHLSSGRNIHVSTRAACMKAIRKG